MIHHPEPEESLLSVACFSAPLAVVQRRVHEILMGNSAENTFRWTRGPVDFNRVLGGRPRAGGSGPRRLMIFEPAGMAAHSAMVTNLRDGWSTLVNILAGHISGTHFLVRSEPAGEYPATSLEVWRDGASVRRVHAMREEGGWVFFQQGEPLAFEDTESYSRRRIRDRFNKSLALETMGRAGWPLSTPDFWRSAGSAWYAEELDQHML